MGVIATMADTTATAAQGSKNGPVTTQSIASKIESRNKEIAGLVGERDALDRKIEKASAVFGADDEIVVGFSTERAAVNDKIERLSKANLADETIERTAQHVGPLVERVGTIKVSAADVSGTFTLAELAASITKATEDERKAKARNTALTAVGRAVQARNIDAAVIAEMPAFKFEPVDENDPAAGLKIVATVTRTRTSSGPRGTQRPYVVSKAPEGAAMDVGTVIRGEGARFATLADAVKELYPDDAKRLQSADSKARTSARVILEGLGYEFTQPEAVAGETDTEDEGEGATEPEAVAVA